MNTDPEIREICEEDNQLATKADLKQLCSELRTELKRAENRIRRHIGAIPETLSRDLDSGFAKTHYGLKETQDKGMPGIDDNQLHPLSGKR